MQGNDLGTWISQHHVVTLVPTIFIPPVRPERKFWQRKTDTLTADDYKLNDLMMRWMIHQGYQYNLSSEVWSFEPEALAEDLFVRLLRMADRCVFRTIRWEHEEDAKADLMANRDNIIRVYDADPDRVDRLWTFNGVKVLEGGCP